jgi:hypothetical protein
MLIVITLVTTFVLFLTGQTLHNPFEIETPETLRTAFLIVIAVIVLLAAVFYFLGKAVAVTVTSEDVSGRTNSLKKVVFPTTSIVDARYESVQGAGALYIRSESSELEICLPLIGVNRRKAREQLFEIVGPLNPLTIWFTENSA